MVLAVSPDQGFRPALFGTKQPAVTKHLSNIYKSGELDEASTYSILEYMGNDGKQKYKTKYYNLDAIISVGYRVNSVNATAFRRWATNGLHFARLQISSNPTKTRTFCECFWHRMQIFVPKIEERKWLSVIISEKSSNFAPNFD